MLPSVRHVERLARVSGWRGYAAAASAQTADMPKASGTFGRYAMALYSAASKQGLLDAVTEDVTAMQKMQNSTEAFDTFLRNPTLPRSAKIATLSEVSVKAGFSSTFSNFLSVVAENGRTAEADKILKLFSDMIASTKGEVVLKVTSTVPLSEWELALLKKNIQSRFFEGAAAEFTVETALDETLLGGLTVQIGDRFMDLSTRTELRKLTEVIGGALS
jgi:F-type H+-transporting ATPase subunit O